MKYLFYMFLFLGTIGFNNQLHAQTYTTESKNCGSCGKTVSNNSRVGMRCPHCGVRWGYENESRTTSYENIKEASYTQPIRPSHNNIAYSSNIGMVKSNANLRKGSSTKAQVIKVLPSHSIITIINRSGDWYYVEYLDYDMNSYQSRKLQGYLHKSVVK